MNNGETKQVIVPEGCRVEVKGEKDGNMDLSVVSMKNGKVAKRTWFEDIAVVSGMTAAIEIAANKAVTVNVDRDNDGVSEEKLTSEDAEVTVFAAVAKEKRETNPKLFVLLGFAALMVIGTAVSLLAITLSYKKKQKKLAA